MSQQSWLRPGLAAAATVLAATMLLTMEAGAHLFHGGIGPGVRHQIATGGVAGERVDEADYDGSIIVECVGFDGRALHFANGAENASMPYAVSMPQYPLGPSKCWRGEHKRLP